MRIAKELTTLFTGLFGPSSFPTQGIAKDSVRKTTLSEAGHQIDGNKSLSPESTGNNTDRVTLSGRIVPEGAILKSSDAPRDLPSPLLPAIDRYGPNTGGQTPLPTYTNRPVVALLPAASVNHKAPQPATDSFRPQESPETRRLVRTVYGSSQSDSRTSENETGSHIRIRA